MCVGIWLLPVPWSLIIGFYPSWFPSSLLFWSLVDEVSFVRSVVFWSWIAVHLIRRLYFGFLYFAFPGNLKVREIAQNVGGMEKYTRHRNGQVRLQPSQEFNFNLSARSTISVLSVAAREKRKYAVAQPPQEFHLSFDSTILEVKVIRNYNRHSNSISAPIILRSSFYYYTQ